MAVSSKRLKLCNFKLDTLLNITQAINENLSVEFLLKRFEDILKYDLNLGKIVVFKITANKWECIVCSGYKEEAMKGIDVEADLLPYEDITFVTNSPNPSLDAFDIVLPVINKDVPIAFVLIGDIDEDLEGISPTIKHLNFIQTLSNIIVVAIENIRMHNESLRQEAIKKELELASKMQNMLIPDSKTLPDNDQIKIKTFYHPHFEIGGDYYDVVQLNDDEIGFCIADVSGKGISAALLMSNFQANLRALFTTDIPISDLIGVLNNRVSINAKGEKFITLFLAKYNLYTRKLEYINAGHNPPLLYEVDDQNMQFLSKGCVGMGMLDEIPIIKKGEKIINQRTKLFCYTDGLVELQDENGIEYGTREIEDIITNTYPLEDNIGDIIQRYKILEGNISIFDDISILGVEFFLK